MHDPRESEDRVVERRIVGRSGCKIDASIDNRDCYVADISVKGARIVLPRTTEMPNGFSIALPWRDDNPLESVGRTKSMLAWSSSWCRRSTPAPW